MFRRCTNRVLKTFIRRSHNVKSNIVLMGSPGCGKTTVGRILAEKLGRPVLDIDDHHLEPHWGTTVAQKLEEVGSEGFVEAEGEALKAFSGTNAVVSLTGSNPMHDEGMKHVANTGTVIFLDVEMTDILERLERMKVNRIVGQNDGTSMAEILKYRQQFYEKWYDARVICEPNESSISIADKVIALLDRPNALPGYESTRGFQMKDMKLNDVLLQGLAPDGGLVVPRSKTPCLSQGQLSRLVNLPFVERAVRILEQWIPSEELHPRKLREFIETAYSKETFGHSAICPVRKLIDGQGQFIQELFHGPTASFKDFALQLMPQMFTQALHSSGENTKYMIVVATSGDTGGAVLDGFKRNVSSSGVGVLVLYPERGISSIQKDQMIAYQGDLTRVIGVQDADFDACQTMVKRLFQDTSVTNNIWRNHNTKLSAANSISWGRLLPQVVYHVSSYLDLVEQDVITMGDKIDVCVPTGNFGNILAAYYAMEMGVPIKQLVCASNSNNVLTEFLKDGRYDVNNRKLIQTTSPAIDILVSSNLERLLFSVSDRDSQLVNSTFGKLKDNKSFCVSDKMLEALKETFRAGWGTEEHCKDVIQRTLHNSGYLLDPHTGIAKCVADRFQEDRPVIITSTAHPGKFAQDMLKFLGQTWAEDLGPTEMIQTLAIIAPVPGIHSALLDTIRQSGSKERLTCNNSYQSIVQEVKQLAEII